jgi:hypothetical protein
MVPQITLEVTVEAVLLIGVLVGALVAAGSSVFVYHWRRAAFDRAYFDRAEFIYWMGLVILGALAISGVIVS